MPGKAGNPRSKGNSAFEFPFFKGIALIDRMHSKRFLSAVCLAATAFSLNAASIVDPSSPLELVSSDFELADGPAWDGSSLWFPDVKGSKLFRYHPKQKKLEVALPDAGRLSAAFFNHGTLYLSDNGNSQISRLNWKKLVRIAGQDPKAKPAARPNDLVVDSQGGIFYTLTARNQVIYIAPNSEQRVAVEGITSANGITLSPDGGTLYVAAYKPKEVWAYDVGKVGSTSGGRKFAFMDDGAALGADGMCIDRAGNVYCAGATAIWIWSPQGKLLDRIEIPERPINCAFGDSDLRTLYITGFGGLYRQRMNTYGVPAHPQSKGTIPKHRASFPSTITPKNVTAKLDVVFAQDGDRKLLADLFLPDSPRKNRPAIVVVHGGGWVHGDRTKFRGLTVELARRGYVTAAIEYRLGYEAKFPKGAQDCLAAVRYLRDHAAELGIDPDRIGAVGGSAGGHLVGLMATAWDNPKLQGNFDKSRQSARLQAAIVMAGPLQMVTGSVAERSRMPDSKSFSNVWLGKSIDEAKSLYQLADAHRQISANDSPVLFMVGEHDKPERNQASREKLKAVGVRSGLKVYPDGKHGCWNRLPWFNDMAADMDEFFKKHLRP
jgi:gluconolactonase